MAVMEDFEAVSDDQVILAWLQAEIESPPFQAYLIGDPPKPSHLAHALTLARNPDLGNAAHNAERRRINKVRMWRKQATAVDTEEAEVKSRSV